jgi:acetyl esterase/lipase
MRIHINPVFCLLPALLIPATARAADAPTTAPVIDVWPGDVPGETGKIGPEKSEQKPKGDKPITLITNVTKPTLTLYRAPKDKDTGAAVIICPGGGYSVLAWDLEGTEVADWLNSIGVTGIVLKYRVPKRPDKTAWAPPLQDAQRAISLVRSKAGEWGIDPKRIGILGFSAGGNLTALACTNFDHRTYEAVDDADKTSCRPDFGVCVYPAWLVDDKTGQLKPEFHVSAETPQMFFVHAGNDGITSANSVEMYLALKHAGVPAEVHIYPTGGHGFGLRPSKEPCSEWPQRCEAWMRSQGLLKGGAVPAK